MNTEKEKIHPKKYLVIKYDHIGDNLSMSVCLLRDERDDKFYEELGQEGFTSTFAVDAEKPEEIKGLITELENTVNTLKEELERIKEETE